MKILIADDIPYICDRIERTLQAEFSEAEAVSFYVRCEKEYQELRTQLHDSPPDLLITDQNFFDFEDRPKGTDVIRWIREELGMKFPIILFTSDNSAASHLKKEWGVKVAGSIGGLKNAVKALLG